MSYPNDSIIIFRLCEELEYSDLLDRAASSRDQLERMLLVSAFAVSSYASAANASRAAHKPFNPLLGIFLHHRVHKYFQIL